MVVLAVLGFAPAGHAEDASKEKCTCDPKPGEVQDNGAYLENATACWASVDEEREWCRITAKALEGDRQHKQIIDQLRQVKDDPGELVNYLYASSQSALAVEGDQSLPTFANASSELQATIKARYDSTSTCISRFLEKGASFEEGDFGCQIGPTGWLRMSYKIGAFRFVFMIAPNA